MNNEKLKAVRKRMGLTEFLPVPINNPMKRLQEESRQIDRIKKIIAVVCLAFSVAFVVALILDK